MRICFTDVFAVLFYFLFFFCPPQKKTRQLFSGTAERIFMKLSPNDTGENGVSNVVPKWVPPPSEWLRKITLCWYAGYGTVQLRRLH